MCVDQADLHGSVSFWMGREAQHATASRKSTANDIALARINPTDALVARSEQTPTSQPDLCILRQIPVAAQGLVQLHAKVFVFAFVQHIGCGLAQHT
ncbi:MULTISPECIES: hypothetical protein [Ralstonia]|jgi:hypothetical protein|uniref:hypothetical protein n=1 Tax=Ralstonia TaxID=48736 RepID=UPI0018ECEA61|nr:MULTISPECIES: hypothetical protein [unclassified Ralstonia]